MLYLDASVLVKRYLHEPGSAAVNAEFTSGARVFTSVLSYAEVHGVFGRKLREGFLSRQDYERLRDDFVADWVLFLNVIELDVRILSFLPELVSQYPLKALDAVHLASSLWLRDCVRVGADFLRGETRLDFWTSDKPLGRVATQSGLLVIDPEQ